VPSSQSNGKMGGKTVFVFFILAIIVLGAIYSGLNSVAGRWKENRTRTIAEQNALRRKANFEKNIEQYYQDFLTKYKQKQYKEVDQAAKAFQTNGRYEYKSVPELHKEALRLLQEQNRIQQIADLQQEAKKIPDSNYQAKFFIYKKLLTLDPQNQQYQKEIAFSQKKLQAEQEARRKKLKAEEEENKKRLARFGPPPENSAWDGSVGCVKEYLKAIAKDPDSLKFGNWSKVFYSNDGWIVLCDWRAKNSFGGYVRSVNWFVIRYNRVIAMKSGDHYRF